MSPILPLLATLLLAGCAGTSRGPRPVDTPWRHLSPLAIDAPIDRLTKLRMRRFEDDQAECQAVLALAGIDARPVPDKEVSSGCGWTNALQVERSVIPARPSFLLSCRATVSLVLWQNQVVAPAALKFFGEPVASFEHMGSYACRNVNGALMAERSRHARADALDVSGFRLQSGRRITVSRGWAGEPDEAAFLREIHGGACSVFDVVLGPDANAAHVDHLHLDKGPSGNYCR